MAVHQNKGVRNLYSYISHLKVVDIRRWSIPKEGCYAVRNVIIIGVCFLLFNGNNKYQTRGRGGKKEKKINVDRNPVRQVEAIMLEALIR